MRKRKRGDSLLLGNNMQNHVFTQAQVFSDTSPGLWPLSSIHPVLVVVVVVIVVLVVCVCVCVCVCMCVCWGGSQMGRRAESARTLHATQTAQTQDTRHRTQHRHRHIHTHTHTHTQRFRPPLPLPDNYK